MQLHLLNIHLKPVQRTQKMKTNLVQTYKYFSFVSPSISSLWSEARCPFVGAIIAHKFSLQSQPGEESRGVEWPKSQS